MLFANLIRNSHIAKYSLIFALQISLIQDFFDVKLIISCHGCMLQKVEYQRNIDH